MTQEQQRKQERVLVALVLAVAAIAGTIWYMAWVVPNDRRMEEVVACMGGDPQRYATCEQEVRAGRR